jgi:hypothetical protein
MSFLLFVVAPHVSLTTPPISTSANVPPSGNQIDVSVGVPAVPATAAPAIVDSTVVDSSVVDLAVVDSTNVDLPSLVTADWSASEASEWFDAFVNSLS